MAVAGLSAMAASLLFALLLLHRAMHPSPDLPQMARQNPEDAPPSTHSIADPDSIPATKPPIVQDAPTPPPHEKSRLSLVEYDSPEEIREREDRLKVTRMLENPDVRVLLITTDVIDASNVIQGLIQKDARATPDFGRITLRTGIVVDPNRPGSAEVFVVPINEGARESFVTRLREKFHELKEEDEKRVPYLVTQLTEIGQVAIYQGTQASSLVAAPVDVRPFAHRTVPDSGVDQILSDERTGGPISPNSPTHSHDKVPLDANSFVGPPTRLKPDDLVTLLVWVTRPGRN